VADPEHGRAFGAEAFGGVLHHGAAFGVKGAGGLVHEQDARLDEHGAQETQPLALAHGQSRGGGVQGHGVEQQPVQALAQGPVVGGHEVGVAFERERQQQVVAHAARDDGGSLLDEGDLAPITGDGHAAPVLAVVVDGARDGLFEPGEHAQECGLAPAGGALEEHELARLHGQVQAAQASRAVGPAEIQRVDVDDGHAGMVTRVHGNWESAHTTARTYRSGASLSPRAGGGTAPSMVVARIAGAERARP